MENFSPADMRRLPALRAERDMLPFTVSLSLQLAQLSWLQPVPGICTVGSGAAVVTHTYSAGSGVLTRCQASVGTKGVKHLDTHSTLTPFHQIDFRH